MHVRDRVRELRRVRAGDLRPNPRNWRVHPAAQQEALRGVLDEIGYAGALLAHELADGTLMLIDGHLRALATPDAVVPVLVLDVDEAEADKILLTHDPLAGMATVAQEHLESLLRDVSTESEAVVEMLARVAREAIVNPLSDEPTGSSKELHVPECYQVVVECRDETEQRMVFEHMRAEGYRCRVLTL